MRPRTDIAEATRSRETRISQSTVYSIRAHSGEEQDFLERGFSLAHFIFPQRTTAVQILTSALNKLKARTRQERKRTFWRDKFLKRGITRISRDEEDALQWLIYLESDSQEKAHEGLGQSRDEDMVVRYIKTLVRLSTGMSSFYVNIAIHRLLHGYTTTEAQQIYEFVTDHYRETDEYRRAKRLLMSRLEARFAGSMHNIKADHGENRYEAAENQEVCRELVMASLQMFTPWSTQEKCPFRHHPEIFSNRLPERLRANCEESTNQDKIEINRCHAFIDPACSGYIVRELGLAPHSSRLEVPRFYMSVDENFRPPSSRLPDGPLTPRERQAAANELSAEETRRKNVTPRELRFFVDGIESACLNLAESRELSFQAPPGFQLLEIWTRDDQGALLLATHVMASANTAHLEPAVTWLLKGGGSVSVVLKEVAHEANPWEVSILVGELPRVPIASRLQQWLSHAPAFQAYVMIVLLVAVLLSSAGLWRELKRERTQAINMEAQPAHYRGALNSLRKPRIETVPTYQLTPDDLITQGNSKFQEHAITVPPVPIVIDLVLPVTSHGLYQILLTRLDGGKSILVEKGLSATARGTETTVTFSLPSNLLTSSKYYQLRLQDSTSHYVRTFTFYTSPTQ